MSDNIRFTDEQQQRASAVAVAAAVLKTTAGGPIVGGGKPGKMKSIAELADYIVTGDPYSVRMAGEKLVHAESLIERLEQTKRDENPQQWVQLDPDDLPEDMPPVLKDIITDAIEKLKNNPTSCTDSDCVVHGDSEVAQQRRQGLLGNN